MIVWIGSPLTDAHHALLAMNLCCLPNSTVACSAVCLGSSVSSVRHLAMCHLQFKLRLDQKPDANETARQQPHNAWLYVSPLAQPRPTWRTWVRRIERGRPRDARDRKRTQGAGRETKRIGSSVTGPELLRRRRCRSGRLQDSLLPAAAKTSETNHNDMRVRTHEQRLAVVCCRAGRGL